MMQSPLGAQPQPAPGHGQQPAPALPPELQQPPPRDARLAGRLVAKNVKSIIGCLVGGFFATPMMMLIMWLKFGDFNAGTIAISCGIGGLAELFAVALFVNMQRAKRLFTTGTAGFGLVRRLAPVEQRSSNKWYNVHVEYQAHDGKVRLASVPMAADRIDFREGSYLPVLHDPQNPRWLAVYSPAAGIMVGRAR